MPAPTKGLNFKTPLPLLKPVDALQLDNLLCRPTHVEVRKGRTVHMTGFGATVKTLISYVPNSGSAKLFAVSGSGIYDATTAGAVGAAVSSGLTNSYCSSTVVGNIGGNTLIVVNGADTAVSYNGTTWGAWGITGVASNLLDFVTVWKRRVWAIEKNTFRAWYLPTDAVSGAATSFEFKAIFSKGGYLAAIVNWTIDGGSGSDDAFVAISSEGEAAIYRGTDPAAAATFALQGLYDIGKPIGRRFFSKYGGDVMLLTVNGLVPLSRFLQSGQADKSALVTDRLGTKLLQDIQDYGSLTGWEVVTYFEQNFLLIQVPAGSVGSYYQYVMNTETGAWSKFLHASLVTWKAHQGALYAGDATRVVNAYTSAEDEGEPIRYRMIPAFSYFGAPTKGKKFGLCRLTLKASSTPTYAIRLLTEFNTSVTIPSMSPTPPSGAVWDTARWDVDVWGGSSMYYRKWKSVTGFGTSATVAVEGVSSDFVHELVQLEYVYQEGGVLG